MGGELLVVSFWLRASYVQRVLCSKAVREALLDKLCP